MNKYTNAFFSSELIQVEDTVLLLTDIFNEIEQGYRNLTPLEKSRILNARLKNLLCDIKRDVAAHKAEGIKLPDSAENRYIPRNSGKASEFLISNYGQYIEAGVCFRPDIKRLDRKLEMALRNEFRGRPDALRKILPNQSDAVDAHIKREFRDSIRPENRRAAQSALSFAKRATRL